MNTKTIEIQKPNIFSFATSELSQDAFFAWLIQWADNAYMDSDRELCILGKRFVSSLTSLPVAEIEKIAVGRQWANIDIWVEINDDSVLIIEDKTGTSIHDDQLQRYKDTIEKEYLNVRKQFFYAYIKTEDESIAISNEIQKNGYKVLNRNDLLKVLVTYQGTDSILLDYRKHLQEEEDKANSYKTLPMEDWGSAQWKRFYKELENHISVEDWQYVANPAGGFWGLWWHFVNNGEVRMYLQFEQDKLCIKIGYDGDLDYSEVRQKYYDILMDVVKTTKWNISKPARFGVGSYMTIGVVNPLEIWSAESVNLDEIVVKLRNLEKLVDECMKTTESL